MESDAKVNGSQHRLWKYQIYIGAEKIMSTQIAHIPTFQSLVIVKSIQYDFSLAS